MYPETKKNKKATLNKWFSQNQAISNGFYFPIIFADEFKEQLRIYEFFLDFVKVFQCRALFFDPKYV